MMFQHSKRISICFCDAGGLPIFNKNGIHYAGIVMMYVTNELISLKEWNIGATHLVIV